VGVEVYLRCAGRRVGGFLDPAGGYFDAAGDFDCLLPPDAVAFPILSKLDPHDIVEIDHSWMPGLIHEINLLLPNARPGPERRGLVRLVEHCVENTAVTMTFMGD
jgi:hypothetical protein